MGNVKLFNTVNEMEQDTTARPDDLAIVYNMNENKITDTSATYSNIWLPKIIPNIYDSYSSFVDSMGTIYFNTNVLLRCDDANYNIRVSMTTNDTLRQIAISIHINDKTFVYNYNEEFNRFELNTIGGVFLSETATRNYTVEYYDPSTTAQRLIRFMNFLISGIRYGSVDFSGLYRFSNVTNSWEGALTQYLAEDADVMGVPYYGVNGVSSGILNKPKYFSDINQANDFANYINKFSSLYQTLDVTNVTNISFIRTANTGLRNMSEVNCVNLQNVSVNNWESLFAGYNFSILKNTGNWNTHSVTNTSLMFSNCYNLINISGISNWDVGNVTNMFGMFRNCRRLTFNNSNDDIFTKWNTTSVTNMAEMFKNCDALSTTYDGNWTRYTYNITNFNFINAVNTSNMFAGCGSLAGFKGFNVTHLAPNLIDTSYMFANCSNLDSFDTYDTYRGSFGLDVSNVVNAAGMFSGCANLSNISIRTLNNATNLSNMFNGCKSLKSIKMNTANTVIDISSMFADCISLREVQYVNISSTTSMANAFRNCMTLTSYNNYAEGYKRFNGNTSNVISMDSTFYGCKAMTVLPNYISFNGVNVRYVNSIFESSGVTNINGTFWNFPNLTGNISRIFNGCWHLTSYNFAYAKLPNLAGFNSSCWVNAPHRLPLILNNAKLDNIESLGLPLDGSITRVEAINLYAPKLNLNLTMNIQNINFANSTLGSVKLNSLLYGGYGININFKGVNVINKPTNAQSIVGAGTGQYSILYVFDLDYELTSEVTSMRAMFSSAQLSPYENGYPYYPYFANFNTSKVTDMAYMFSNCNMLCEIPTYETSNVRNMAYMFYNQRTMNGFHNAPPFNVANVTNFNSMFKNCYYIRNIPEYNMYNADDIVGMFANCLNIKYSTDSVQNIINSFLSIRPESAVIRNLSTSNTSGPLYGTGINSDMYSDRLQELDDAGWTY